MPRSRSLLKEVEALPIRRSPNGVRHTRPQPGRDRPEWVVAILRNEWSQSIVIGGRNQPVRQLNLVGKGYSAQLIAQFQKSVINRSGSLSPESHAL
jgi:hypothetical protein